MGLSNIGSFFDNVDEIRTGVIALEGIQEKLGVISEQLKAIIFLLEARGNGKEI